MLDIQGAAGAGKTSLLLFLAVTALVPQHWTPAVDGPAVRVETSGKEQHVVFVDCTQRFDIERLAALLHAFLSAQLVTALGPGRREKDYTGSVELEVLRCLERLHVYSPASIVELAATLLRLPTDLAELESAQDLAYLLVDGSSEFVWDVQLEKEHADAAAKGYARADSTAAPTLTPLRLFVSALAHVRQKLSPVIVLTHWVLRAQNPTHHSSDGLPFFGQHLPAPYPTITTPFPAVDPTDPLRPHLLPETDISTVFLKYHIQLFAPPVRSIGRSKTFEDAFAERQEGRGAGMQGFRAVLRAAGGQEVGTWEWDVLENAIHA